MKNPHPPAWTRFFRRLFRPFLSHAEKVRVADVLKEIDQKTSAEIHVHIIYWMGRRDPVRLAREIFEKLKLHENAGRNGILILVSHFDHKFAIWGDEAVHETLGDPLWQKASRTLLEHFKARRYAEGLIICAREMGQELEKRFPRLRK